MSKPSLIYDYSSYAFHWMYGKSRGKVQSYISTTFNAHPIEKNGRVWLGDIATASNTKELKEQKFTHIVSAVLGVGKINKKFKCHYVPVRDVEWEDLYNYFDSTADFIENALMENKTNKVLVHCVCGVSRSATLIASWLIKYQKFSANEAIEYLQKIRSIVNPNPGFRKQLEKFEMELIQ